MADDVVALLSAVGSVHSTDPPSLASTDNAREPTTGAAEQRASVTGALSPALSDSGVDAVTAWLKDLKLDALAPLFERVCSRHKTVALTPIP